MEDLAQSNGLNVSLNVDDDVNAEAENVKNEMETTKRNASNAEAPVKRLKNIHNWSTPAYAVLHKCLEDPGGEPRQPTE